MKARQFLITNTASSMLEDLGGLSLVFDKEKMTVDEIKGLDFISALKSQHLVNYLQSEGITSATLGLNVKFKLQKGDEIFIVNPNTKLHLNDAPNFSALTIRRAVVKEQ